MIALGTRPYLLSCWRFLCTYAALHCHFHGLSVTKRRSYLVQLKAGLVRSSVPPQTGYGVLPRLLVSRRLLEPVSTCLVPAIGPDEVFQPHCSCSLRPRWHGVNHCNQVSRTAARCGPVNAWSLQNKSVIPKYLFSSRELDFLFVTETWLDVGESSSSTNSYYSTDCCYFNSPRTSGRGGGTVWRLSLRVTFDVSRHCLCHPLAALNCAFLNWDALIQCCVLWSTGLPSTARTFLTIFLYSWLI